ncbi:hypothetical protein F4780DRAFT_613471 [Xylariomycetidae sp. FL0641]|nr:hypothetical protein F4780DRAFT_613471 [Xylariomycetidae sp. FL0641]
MISNSCSVSTYATKGFMRTRDETVFVPAESRDTHGVRSKQGQGQYRSISADAPPSRLARSLTESITPATAQAMRGEPQNRTFIRHLSWLLGVGRCRARVGERNRARDAALVGPEQRGGPEARGSRASVSSAGRNPCLTSPSVPRGNTVDLVTMETRGEESTNAGCCSDISSRDRLRAHGSGKARHGNALLALFCRPSPSTVRGSGAIPKSSTLVPNIASAPLSSCRDQSEISIVHRILYHKHIAATQIPAVTGEISIQAFQV